MTDVAWISAAIGAARPQAVAALLRYFRDLDMAEEAFQEACLRALKAWPKNGPPRDPAAWLIFVGRNSGIDQVRKRARQAPMPEEDLLSDLGDAEADMAERLDGAHYRDDILRLLFICCHPDLPQTQQIALALRIVSGLSVKQIARAFVVSEAAMEQRITRAKARIADAGVPFETPGAVERAERLAAVAAMVYLVFNEGYSSAGAEASARAPLAEEAIRLVRLLLRLFPAEPENHGARGPDAAAACAGAGPLRCRRRPRAAGGSGPQPVARRDDRRGAGAGGQGAAPRQARPLPGSGGDRGLARARQAPRGDGLARDRPALRSSGAAAALARW